MPWVWVSIGSNIDRAAHVCAALAELRARFGELRCSAVYETPAEGFEGAPFYNSVVGFFTDLPAADLYTVLREIEAGRGRTRGGEPFAARTLDLDALTYGDLVGEVDGKWLPRSEILRYAFVLGPLAEVAGSERHPQTGRSYEEEWADFSAGKAALRRVDLDCD